MAQAPVAFSGQITPDQLPQVAEQGFRSVINNRPDYEHGPDQPASSALEAAAQNAGLGYVHQPVVSGQITQQDVERFAEQFNQMAKPILMFCRSGARSNNLFQLAQQMDLLDL